MFCRADGEFWDGLHPYEGTDISDLESLFLESAAHACGGSLDLSPVEVVGVQGVFREDVRLRIQRDGRRARRDGFPGLLLACGRRRSNGRRGQSRQSGGCELHVDANSLGLAVLLL